jgi:hypothetical protein
MVKSYFCSSYIEIQAAAQALAIELTKKERYVTKGKRMMKKNKRMFLLLYWGIVLFTGCVSQTQNIAKNDFEKPTAKVIAVLPVDNKTTDFKASQLLRLKVLDELYFKGYSKLPLEVIDKKLEPLHTIENNNVAGVVAPPVIKGLVGADAAMYCTLTEGNRKTNLFYLLVTVAARCELRSTQTGEVIWKAQHKITSRNFNLPGKSLELKSYEAFEPLIEHVVNNILETLPDGPNLKE